MRGDFKTYKLAVAFYRQIASIQMPRHLKDQLLRASSSVVLNLAEGSGRSSRADQARFFDIAFASLRESQAVLDLALPEQPEAEQSADILAAHIFKLIKSCRP